VRSPSRRSKLRTLAGIALLVVAAISLAAYGVLREIEGNSSSRALPGALQRELAPSTDVLHTPQTTLFNWEGSVVLARTDPAAHSIALLSIPRSARIPVRARTLTLAAATRHGVQAVLLSLRDVLDARLSHVVMLDDQGLARLLDSIGGIAVRDPIFGRNPVQLDGARALQYITLPAASQRQRLLRRQAIMDGLVGRLLHPTDIADAAQEIRDVARAVTTDLTPRETLGLALVRSDSHQFIDCRLGPRIDLRSPLSRVTLRSFLGAPHEGAAECETRPLDPALPSVASTVLKGALDLYPIAGTVLLGLTATSALGAALLLVRRRPRLAPVVTPVARRMRLPRLPARQLGRGLATTARRAAGSRATHRYGYGSRAYPSRRRRLARTVEDAFYALADGWDYLRDMGQRRPRTLGRRPPRASGPPVRDDGTRHEEPKRASLR
jgi:anionic cell wall polymer biosynthesis LytR-Cps2A-Psr (LCP) family protein